jgi:glycosyltransferase involved in cell wall biosynthesis
VRILNVITDPDRRGAQVFAHDLSEALSARGHTVDAVALARDSNSGAVLEVEVLGRGARDLGALRALRARMAAVDMTIAHGAATGPACALAGGGRRRPFVYRQISDSRFWAPTRTRQWRVRAALGRAARVVALSEFNRRELVDWIGVPTNRIRVVPNGVPTAPYTVADALTRAEARSALQLPDGPLVLAVGALVPEKGVDVAIDAVGAMNSDTHLAVAGDGPERGALESRAAARAPGRVHFLGSLADVVPAYHAADVVAFPSRGGDAMPAAIIEAGLCGLPVVAIGIGAIPEVVLNGTTGIIVPTPLRDAFTSELARLLDDGEARHAMGTRARAHCLAHFSITTVTTGWEAVLEEARRAAG